MLNVLSINNCVPHLVRCGTLVVDCFAVNPLSECVHCKIICNERTQCAKRSLFAGDMRAV